MGYINTTILSGSNATTASGAAIDASQLISASFQTHFGDNQAAGTIKIQVSNDHDATHWTDIPTKSSTITSGFASLITIPQNAYRWLRASWTSTGTGTQTIATNGAGYGIAQAVTVVCNPDVAGNLNSTYFKVYSPTQGYYVWYSVSGGGVDPAVPGLTGIRVNITTNEDDVSISIASAAAISAVGGGAVFNAFDATGEIVIYCLVEGSATAPSDGPGGHATGFAIDLATPGANPLPDQLGNQYFFVNAAIADGGAQYYLWFNVDGGGVDPGPIAGKTGVEIDIFSTDPANGVANAVQSALQTLTEFTNVTVTPADGNLVTFSNVSAGSFIPASDFNTTFVFAVTSGGSSTINVTMDAVS